MFLSVAVLVLLCVSNVYAQDQPTVADNSWLNGKWEGTPPQGGRYLMELQVVNGSEVKGTGKLQHVKAATVGEINGTVKGTKVDLKAEHQSSRQNSTVRYRLTYNDGVLSGTAGKRETVFTKVE
jgi:hypothetical protein